MSDSNFLDFLFFKDIPPEVYLYTFVAYIFLYIFAPLIILRIIKLYECKKDKRCLSGHIILLSFLLFFALIDSYPFLKRLGAPYNNGMWTFIAFVIPNLIFVTISSISAIVVLIKKKYHQNMLKKEFRLYIVLLSLCLISSLTFAALECYYPKEG